MKELNKHTFGDTPEHFKVRLAGALQEEDRPMKGRSKAYVMVIAMGILLVALACTALAVVFGNYEGVLETEISEGYFDTWPTEARLSLVEQMMTDGMILKDERTEALFGGELDDEAKKALATELVTEALNTREDLVSYVSIMETVRGPFEDWTLEQKAEYSELQKQLGRESSEAEFYMAPTEKDVTQEEAIRIAQEGLEKAFGWEAGTLDSYDVRSEFYRMKQGPQEPRWLVEFSNMETAVNDMDRQVLTAVVSSTGELIDDPERGILSPEKEVVWRAENDALNARKAAEGDHTPIYMWTLEEQAIVFPFARGLPGADDVPLEQAIQTANDTVIREGIYTEAELAEVEVYPSFVTQWTDNLEVPFWSIAYVRYHADREFPYEEERLVYVDAKTGEVVWYFGMND